MNKIAAIILAAGESSRMGTPKPLLRYRGTTFLEHIIAAVREAGAAPIIVVLGHEPARIRSAIDLSSVDVHINTDYRQGQLSSLQTGIRALDETEADGVLVCLADHPVINPLLVHQLIDAFARTGKNIVIPMHGDRRGHPVIFGAKLFPDLLSAPRTEGARVVVRDHPNEICYLPVDNPGILSDIDTPDDYQDLDK